MTNQQVPTRPRSALISALLTFVVVLAVTMAASAWWQKRSAAESPQVIHLPTPSDAPPSSPAQPAAAEPSATPAHAAPGSSSEGSVVVPTLTAWVVHADQDIAVSGDNISLPSGAQFALKVRSNVDGSLAFFTINPNGVSAEKPLWTREIKAGSAVAGPGLRLEGTKGLETLRVILLPASGGDEIEQHVQIWHQ